jgi:hypothetical protein
LLSSQKKTEKEVITMSIYISNNSVSAVVQGYVYTAEGLVVWLEIAPQHPKVVGAVRAELTSNTRRYLQLRDDEVGRSKMVYGLGRGYLNLTADAPQLAVGHRAKAQLLRMISPEAVKPEDVSRQFYALAWPRLDPATALAAILERHSPFPVQIGWGPHLLAKAVEEYDAEPLISGGKAPAGYAFPADTPWADIISQGIREGKISLDGALKRLPVLIPELAA